MALASAAADLSSSEIADALFLSLSSEDASAQDAEWVTDHKAALARLAADHSAADLRTSPLPTVSSPEQLDAMRDPLVSHLRAVAPSRSLLSKIPESFYTHCSDHLVPALSYYYVETLIKDHDKARCQIMYEIAKDSWVLADGVKELIGVIEGKVDDVRTTQTDCPRSCGRRASTNWAGSLVIIGYCTARNMGSFASTLNRPLHGHVAHVSGRARRQIGMRWKTDGLKGLLLIGS